MTTTRSISSVLLVSGTLIGFAYGGGEKQRSETAKAVIPSETYTPVNGSPISVTPDINPRTRPASVGTYTTLTGYYDYQANGTPQHIRVNPANGNIHVIFMIATDSTAPNAASRRTAYAFSSNGGTTWNNFTNVQVPGGRRSGFPSIDLLKGPNAGLPAIANHSVIAGTGLQSGVFVDSPEGTGAFSELNAPPLLDVGAPDEPIWPYVAGPNDGSVVIHSSRSTAGGPLSNHLNRTEDFSTWTFPAPWHTFPNPQGSGGRNATVANASGRVATIINAVSPTSAAPANGGLYLYESTNNGAAWGPQVTIHPPFRVAGADTLGMWVSADITYNGNNVFAALNTSRLNLATGGLFFADAKIDFWSAATGLVVAVPHDTALFVNDMNNRSQSNHLTLGGPSIAMSGSTVVIVFQAFQRDTAVSGYRHSDVWYVRSNNNGVTWSRPVNLTNTRTMDERYPSISKYNEPGYINMTWQEDPQPGNWATAIPDAGALPARNRQVFLKLALTDVPAENGVPNAFKLEQNYPNPFNPTTTIAFVVGTYNYTSLRVYDVLGREVATLVNELKQPGHYEVTFDASGLASGVYLYRLQSGGFTAVKKLLLLK